MQLEQKWCQRSSRGHLRSLTLDGQDINNCDVTKQNGSELANIDLEIELVKRTFFFLLFCKTSACISETKQQIFMGFYA